MSSKGNIFCRLIKIELYKIFAIINRAIKGLHCTWYTTWTLNNMVQPIWAPYANLKLKTRNKKLVVSELSQLWPENKMKQQIRLYTVQMGHNNAHSTWLAGGWPLTQLNYPFSLGRKSCAPVPLNIIPTFPKEKHQFLSHLSSESRTFMCFICMIIKRYQMFFENFVNPKIG